MKLYIADIRQITPDRISELSEQRAQRALRYRTADDKKRCIAGGLMINRFLNGAVISNNEYGKPVADNGLHFNLSHSGDYVIFAVSDSPVGCDIQKTEFIKSESAGRIVFCDNEMHKLSTATDKTGEFYRLWTKKESLLKCIGKGFHRPAKSVDVSGSIYSENGQSYYFKQWCFADYIICICSPKNNFPHYPEFIKL